VKEAIVQHVQRSYKHGQDIAVSLRELKVKDLKTLMPKRGQSAEEDTSANANEQTGMDIVYQAELERYLDCKQMLEENLTKSYALIFSNYCNLTMQNRIEEHPDYEETIQDDPIQLLTKIKVLMHDPIRAKYPFASLTEAMNRMQNIKQIENKGLLTYVKRFKQSRDIMKSHMGTDILDKFVENTREYQEQTEAAKKQELKDGPFDKWMAYLLIQNSDQSKYGTLLNGLVSQFSMDNNQCPKNIMSATDILSNHKHDPRKDKGNGKRNKYNNKKEDNDKTAPSTITTIETSFVQNSKDQTCYCCGKQGHISPECPDKNTIKKKEWFIHKAQLHVQAAQQAEREDVLTIGNASATNDQTPRVSWSGLLIARSIEEESHYNNNQEMGTRLKNWITLDNRSTLSLFLNPDLVEDIQTSSKTLVLATNAGVTQHNEEATIPGFGKVYFDRDAIANIFRLSDLKKKFQITCNSDKEDAFLVHKKDGIVKFECSLEGLYQYEVSKVRKKDLKNSESGASNLISTVTKNWKGYTLQQFERAKEARKLYHIIGTPTMKSFRLLLQMNVIKNCPMTVEDVSIAEKISGPDVSSLKGKSTRRKPKPVRKDNIEIPKELIMKHHDIQLCMDTMYINEKTFLSLSKLLGQSLVVSCAY